MQLCVILRDPVASTIFCADGGAWQQELLINVGTVLPDYTVSNDARTLSS
jgi:hypothetical protein